MWIPHVFFLCRWVFYCVLQVLWQFPSRFYHLQYWVIGPEDFSMERIICRWDNLKATYNTNKVGSLLFVDLPVYTPDSLSFFSLRLQHRVSFLFPTWTSRHFFFQNIRVCDLSTKGCAWSVPVRFTNDKYNQLRKPTFPFSPGTCALPDVP